MMPARLRPFGLAAALLLASPVLAQGEIKGERVDEPVFGQSVMLYRAGPVGAEPVVLIHGLSQYGARYLDDVVHALAARYEVFALDLPGFGRSDKGYDLYSPANFVRVIEAVVGKRVSRPFVLVGHSMGGAVSIAYAAAHPERVRRLIVVDAAGILHRAVYAQLLHRAARELVVGKESPGAIWLDSFVQSLLIGAEALPDAGRAILATPELRLSILRGDPNAIAAYALVERDFSRDLRAIKAPTLVIWGSEDKLAPLRTGQLTAALIPGARLTLLDGVGHVPMQEQPGKFNALVLDELDGRLSLAPYALARGDPGTRTGTCDGQSKQTFSGDYKAIVLKNCDDVQIVNARVGMLTAHHSSVQMVNSHLYGGLWAIGSRFEITAGLIGGDPPLALDGTSVDAAGTRFESSGVVAHNRGAVPVTLSFSVVEVAREKAAPRYVHRIVRIAPAARW